MEIMSKELSKLLLSLQMGAKGRAKGSGVLSFRPGRICVFNQLIGITIDEPSIDFSIDVSFDQVFKVSKKLTKTQSVKMWVKKGVLFLTNGKFQAKFSQYDSDIFTELSSLEIDPTLFQVLPEQIKSAMEELNYPEHGNKNQYSGIYLTSDFAMVTDATIIINYIFDNKSKDGGLRIWLTAEAASIIRQLLSESEEIYMAVYGTWAYIRQGKLTSFLRLLSIENNPFDRIQTLCSEYIDNGLDVVTIEIKEDTTELLKRMTFDSDEGQQNIYLYAKDDTLQLHTGKMSSIQVKEDVHAKITWHSDEEEFHGCVRASFLEYCLSKTNTFTLLSYDNRYAFYFEQNDWFSLLIFNPIKE